MSGRTIAMRPSSFGELDMTECGDCAAGSKLEFAFSYAYQPIVDLRVGEVFAYEALVRGPAGEPAPTVLAQVNEHNRYRFDQACRVKAIKDAVALGLKAKLSINFLPNAVYRPEVCIRATLAAAQTHGFPIEQIIFETTEGEQVGDAAWYAEVMREYQRIGFSTAIDDFGAGYAGLSLLADFQPDLIKLDMLLLRGIDAHRPRQRIVARTLEICRDLDIAVIAEGIETTAERDWLWDHGVHLMQGYLFARPAFQQLLTPAQIDHLRR